MCDPRTETAETATGEFLIWSSVPGFKPSDILVSWGDKSVRIVGHVRQSAREVAAHDAQHDFMLLCPVPDGFEPSRLRARMSLNVLVVTVPPRTKPLPCDPETALTAAN